MGVHITIAYRCGGCDAKAESGGHPVRREFVSLSGRDSGIGVYRLTPMPDVDMLAPEGWVVFDPWTQCTYCPACWASIEGNAGGQR